MLERYINEQLRLLDDRLRSLHSELPKDNKVERLIHKHHLYSSLYVIHASLSEYGYIPLTPEVLSFLIENNIVPLSKEEREKALENARLIVDKLIEKYDNVGIENYFYVFSYWFNPIKKEIILVKPGEVRGYVVRSVRIERGNLRQDIREILRGIP